MECGNEGNRQKVLLMDGDDLNGAIIRVSKVERGMTGEELMKFVGERLRRQEDLTNLEKSLGLQPKSEPEKKSEAVPQFFKWGKKAVQEVAVGPSSPPFSEQGPWVEESWPPSWHSSSAAPFTVSEEYVYSEPPQAWTQPVQAKGHPPASMGKGQYQSPFMQPQVPPRADWGKGAPFAKGKGFGKGKGKGVSWGGRGEPRPKNPPPIYPIFHPLHRQCPSLRERQPPHKRRRRRPQQPAPQLPKELQLLLPLVRGRQLLGFRPRERERAEVLLNVLFVPPWGWIRTILSGLVKKIRRHGRERLQVPKMSNRGVRIPGEQVLQKLVSLNPFQLRVLGR